MNDLQKLLKEHKRELVALAKKHGYTISEEELVALAEGQLTDEQLAAASGGWGEGLGGGVARNR